MLLSKFYSSLEYLAFGISDENNVELFNPFYDGIFEILERYQQHPLRDGDIAFVESMLVTIAFGLVNFNRSDTRLSQLIIKTKKSRFNASRQKAEWLIAQQG